MSDILIAGGLGFLGVNLTLKLLNYGHKITIIDNLITGKKNNLKFLQDKDNVKIINHDIIYPLDLKTDEIYNLACPASPPFYQNDPIHTTKTSVIGSLNLLELADKNKAKILQASTSEVYGDPLEHPQNENYWGNVNPIGIRSCYDEGKRCAESLFMDFHRQNKLKIKICRIFNTYGPYMRSDDGRVVSNFINQAIKGEDITIYGNGEQTRSFCYVSDLVDGIIALMNSNNEITGPINLGNYNEFTINELANMVITKANSKSKLIRKKLPSDDPKIRRPNIEKAKKELNWQPKIQLDEGLDLTIKYFKKII
jgi:UDP-glucuronate decarboxylase